jgi:hypothetical protein
MVFVQHTLTQLYLQSFADWSAELNDAWVFANMKEAVDFCELWRLKDVQVVVAEELDVHQFPLPVRSLAFPIERLRIIPVVLPRTDSRPN